SRTELVRARLKGLLQIVDLLVEILDLVLARSELRLQLGGSHLAFRGGDNGLANTDDADLTRRDRAGRGGRLRPGDGSAENARGPEGNGTSQHISRPQSGQHIS